MRTKRSLEPTVTDKPGCTPEDPYPSGNYSGKITTLPLNLRKVKELQQKLGEHRYFLWFIFFFAYAHSIQFRSLARGKINLYTFTPEAAVASWISACVLFLIIRKMMQWRRSSSVFSFREALVVFGLSVLLYFLAMQAFGLVIALAFDTVERNFNRSTFFNHSFILVMDALIYGSFFLAYDYHRKNRKHRKEIEGYHNALAESRISHLKNQLNPHFLFNNLNVLDQLIEEDKRRASDFLNEFADIYRYVLQASDIRLAALGEELSFARKYFNLMEHKYGNAYRLTVSGEENGSGRMVPLALQLLLENVFRHNFGTEDRPVEIHIRLGANIVVSNTRARKRAHGMVSGRALANLHEQYRLLAGQEPEIKEAEDLFTVILPRIA